MMVMVVIIMFMWMNIQFHTIILSIFHETFMIVPLVILHIIIRMIFSITFVSMIMVIMVVMAVVVIMVIMVIMVVMVIMFIFILITIADNRIVNSSFKMIHVMRMVIVPCKPPVWSMSMTPVTMTVPPMTPVSRSTVTVTTLSLIHI